jgi:bifunctional non-homologous end joining protein LigD
VSGRSGSRTRTRPGSRARRPSEPPASPRRKRPGVAIPDDVEGLTLDVQGRDVRLTNLCKPFWPELGLTKGDLLRYYAELAPALVPHLAGRAMVMKRYPHGAAGEFFFMKRAPTPRPPWIRTCRIEHGSGNVIDFPIVEDLASLLWLVNLGCIDLNPWYSRCDDTDRPDFLHFDLDPGPGAPFPRVREVAGILRATLEDLRMPTWVKTTGSRGLHVYVPIRRGPLQKEVWTVAKAIALDLAKRHPHIITSEYRVAKRPRGRVLVDYNQNAWGRTLASVYSVRPRPDATVSTPVTWDEVEAGIRIEDFHVRNVPERVGERGDLWKGLLGKRRYDLAPLVEVVRPPGRKRASQEAGPSGGR